MYGFFKSMSGFFSKKYEKSEKMLNKKDEIELISRSVDLLPKIDVNS